MSKKPQKAIPSVGREKTKRLLSAPRGIQDILPPEVFYFEKLENIISDLAAFYNYERIELSLLESKALFERSLGLEGGTANKQLYVCQTKSRDKLVLRPEATTGSARAYIQNSMFNWPQPVKLWYWGPMFYQGDFSTGKHQQFWQAGFEYFGSDNPIVEAELIQLGLKISKKFGLKNSYVEINSIGCSGCRRIYRRALKQHYRYKLKRVCSDCRNRYKKNALQLLNCENKLCFESKTQAPESLDYLCKSCNLHFKKVLDHLDSLAIPYLLNPRLVRGLDYYNRTVFEFRADSQELGAKTVFEDKRDSIAFAGGGRYDYLVKQFGGPDTPGCGFALEVEKIISLINKDPNDGFVDVYLVQIGNLAKIKLLQLFEDFKKAKIKIGFDLGSDNLKPQLKSAARLGSRFALILGQEEALHGEIIIRDMKTGAQETVSLGKVINLVKKRLKKKSL
ncbi:MAG: histidine--tRNA ligase [Patescibacteria group bacterium]